MLLSGNEVKIITRIHLFTFVILNFNQRFHDIVFSLFWFAYFLFPICIPNEITSSVSANYR